MKTPNAAVHISDYLFQVEKISNTYQASIPCMTISFCLDSAMSCVNIALKYGMVADRTIR